MPQELQVTLYLPATSSWSSSVTMARASRNWVCAMDTETVRTDQMNTAVVRTMSINTIPSRTMHTHMHADSGFKSSFFSWQREPIKSKQKSLFSDKERLRLFILCISTSRQFKVQTRTARSTRQYAKILNRMDKEWLKKNSNRRINMSVWHGDACQFQSHI